VVSREAFDYRDCTCIAAAGGLCGLFDLIVGRITADVDGVDNFRTPHERVQRLHICVFGRTKGFAK
jgi:hypothetical protein